MTIEGELIVRLEHSGRRVRRVTVRSTRPYAASRVVLGRPPAEAVAMVPSLFGICAHAQGAAAALAVEAATGRSPEAESLAAREAAVVLETIQEYLWRLLVDWPQAAGHDAQIEPVASARRSIAPLLASLAPLARRIAGNGMDAAPEIPEETVTSLVGLAAQYVYGITPKQWLAATGHDAVAAWAASAATEPARLLRDLLARAPELGRSKVALMPSSEPAALLAAVVPAMRLDPAFERVPTWAGATAETGALARTCSHPIVATFVAEHGNAVPTRMVARLTELGLLLRRLSERPGLGAVQRWTESIRLAGGEGIAAVQTARGLLLHRATVTEGRVAGYQIVAPTEWNFHPEGALVRGLEGATATDAMALERDARLIVQALDPCVACRVEVAGA